MLLQRVICLTLLLMAGVFSYSQEKALSAIKTASPPKIDGTLDDLAWKEAPVANAFIQNFPNYGLPATQKTDVRVVYDNNAIYIGAHLYEIPSLIRKQITARDEGN